MLGRFGKNMHRRTRRLLFRTRRQHPISKIFGFDRGTPIDRYYIKKFLEVNRASIKGKVLEVEEDGYAKMFAKLGSDISVLKYVPDSKKGVSGDLTKPASLPQKEFDCFICTQTLNFIFDLPRAIEGIKALLKPGGVALITVAGISQISRYDMNRWGDYWRFTDASIKRLLKPVFGNNPIEIGTWGNFRSATSFLDGRAAEELTEIELDAKDPDYQVLITAKVSA